MDDPDPLGEARDLGEDVARHEDGQALLASQFQQELTDLDDAGRIEAVGRLIQEEQFGTMQ